MKESELNYDDLPKFVLGGINKATGTIGLIRYYDVSDDAMIGTSRRIPVWATLEEATAAYEAGKDTMSDWIRPVHLDDLHREHARYLAEIGQLGQTGGSSMSEELYRLANHIDGAKGALPNEWQDWADEVVGHLRSHSATLARADETNDEVVK